MNGKMFNLPKFCQRCGKRNCALIMSMFDTDMICLECKEKEEKHSDYEKAKKEELKQVRQGNRNFSGIGKPSDL